MTRKGTSGAAGIVAYWMQTAGGKCSHGRHQNVWASFRNGDDKESIPAQHRETEVKHYELGSTTFN